MISTQVGYAGGTAKNPTYHRIGDHSESIQIIYDPAVISYEALLNIFWAAHNPTSPAYSRQYMSAIFAHDEGQRLLAESSKQDEGRRRGSRVATEIVSEWTFTPAEAYHQKYSLRGDPVLEGELKFLYPDDRELVRSTAAARINGYLGGFGTLDQLDRIIESLGLSPDAAERLRSRVGRSRR